MVCTYKELSLANKSNYKPPHSADKATPINEADEMFTISQVKLSHYQNRKASTMLWTCKHCIWIAIANTSCQKPPHPLNGKITSIKPNSFLSSALLFTCFYSLLFSPLGEVTPIPNPFAGIHSLFNNFL